MRSRMNLLVSGDVHGHLDWLFEVVPKVEAGAGCRVAGLLLAGDLAAFGAASHIDRATRVRAAEDPAQLGMMPYMEGSKRSPLPVLCVRGNHEDHDLVERLGRYLDPFQKIERILDGHVVSWHGLKIAGLGRIARPPNSKQRSDKRHYFVQSEVDRLLRAEGPVDILLCHDGPVGYCLSSDSRAGSEEILRIVRHLAPRLTLFGHYHSPCRPQKMDDGWIVPLNQHDVLEIPGQHSGIGLFDLETGEFRFLDPNFSLVSVDGALPR